jgi:hypothetical protein
MLFFYLSIHAIQTYLFQASMLHSFPSRTNTYMDIRKTRANLRFHTHVIYIKII